MVDQAKRLAVARDILARLYELALTLVTNANALQQFLKRLKDIFPKKNDARIDELLAKIIQQFEQLKMNYPDGEIAGQIDGVITVLRTFQTHPTSP